MKALFALLVLVSVSYAQSIKDIKIEVKSKNGESKIIENADDLVVSVGDTVTLSMNAQASGGDALGQFFIGYKYSGWKPGKSSFSQVINEHHINKRNGRIQLSFFAKDGDGKSGHHLGDISEIDDYQEIRVKSDYKVEKPKKEVVKNLAKDLSPAQVERVEVYINGKKAKNCDYCHLKINDGDDITLKAFAKGEKTNGNFYSDGKIVKDWETRSDKVFEYSFKAKKRTDREVEYKTVTFHLRDQDGLSGEDLDWELDDYHRFEFKFGHIAKDKDPAKITEKAISVEQYNGSRKTEGVKISESKKPTAIQL
jgi:hypothetical protein